MVLIGCPGALLSREHHCEAHSQCKGEGAQTLVPGTYNTHYSFPSLTRVSNSFFSPGAFPVDIQSGLVREISREVNRAIDQSTCMSAQFFKHEWRLVVL